MERLSGAGAAFLAVETATTPMHVATLCLLDPATAPGGFGLATIRRQVEARLHLLAPLRRRVVEVPWGLDRPVLVDDPHFALDDHLHAVSLTAPGGHDALAGAVADILARPLSRTRPLWELHVVEGLEGGRVAVVAKMHHAVADGIVGAELLLRLFDAEPDPLPAAPEPAARAPAPLPAPATLMAAALAGLAGRPQAVLRAAQRTLAAAVQLGADGSAGLRPPAPFSAPRTPLNVPLSGQRSVGWAHLPLDEVKRVKAAHGCKVNDVVLALCAHALRAHLGAAGALPDRDLVALMPLAVGGPDGGGSANHLSPALVSLATTIDDPVERLAAIAASASRAKAQEGALGPGVVQEWADAALPGAMAAAARAAGGLRVVEWLPPACNVVVSNVAGPPFPLYLAGAKVAALVPFGPLIDGVALNVTVLSAAGTLHAGVVADCAAVPDAGAVAALLAPALAALTGAPATAGGDRRPPGGEEPRC